MDRKTFGNLHYVVSFPEPCEAGRRYPLVIYLHGAGGRGRDLKHHRMLRSFVTGFFFVDKANKKLAFFGEKIIALKEL